MLLCGDFTSTFSLLLVKWVLNLKGNRGEGQDLIEDIILRFACTH